MRHSHAGLSIPDFPPTYGGLVCRGSIQLQLRKSMRHAAPLDNRSLQPALSCFSTFTGFWALLIGIAVVWTSVK